MTHDMVLDLCGTVTNFEHCHSLYLSLSMLLGVIFFVLCNTSRSNKVPFIKLKLVKSKDIMCPCKVLHGIPQYIWRALYMYKHPSQKRGGILHLLPKSGKGSYTSFFLCVRSQGGIKHVPLLKDRCKNTPHTMADDLCMFRL